MARKNNLEASRYWRPWYKIMWSLLWFLPVLVSRSLCAVLIGIANLDLSDIARFWEATS